MDSQQSQANSTSSGSSAPALTPDSERVQERKRLLAVFKTFYDTFSEELYEFVQIPELTSFEMPTWPTELSGERNRAEQRLLDSSIMSENRVRSLRIFAGTSRQVAYQFRYELVLLKLVQDELYGVPGADVHLLKLENYNIAQGIRRSNSDLNFVTRIVLYDAIEHCDMEWHHVPRGSDAVVMPCPKKHTYCAECVLKWVRARGTNAIHKCPGCKVDVMDHGIWYLAFDL
jgi:hypothetical protein